MIEKPRWGFCVVASAINYKHSAPNGAKVSVPELWRG